VDANGLIPIRIAEKEYLRAHDFRRYLHKNFVDFLVDVPEKVFTIYWKFFHNITSILKTLKASGVKLILKNLIRKNF
ncbi:hypothetical protein N9V32_02685, partial [Candidatus Actinomarina sp.]|nr:hypothetical protein [Candidatus Actinomarina sp.]